MERRARAERRLHREAAAVHLDEAPGNGETEPGTTLVARARVVDLLKVFKYACLVMRRDARAGIAHCDVEGAVGGLGANLDLAGFGELHGIAHQIEQDL